MPVDKQYLNESLWHDKSGHRWRRNGRTRLWKTRPEYFRVPIKFGLRDYGYITEHNAYLFHLPGTAEESCETCRKGIDAPCGKE